MTQLRNLSADRLIEATSHLALHEFRGVSEDDFVSGFLFDDIDDGTFASLLRKHGIEELFSEVKDECTTYAECRSQKTCEKIRKRLLAGYYPDAAVDAIMGQSVETPGFGAIYACVQAHCTQ